MLQVVHELTTRLFLSPRAPSRRARRLVRSIDREASRLEAKQDSELRQAAAALRYRARSGEPLDALLCEAFALVVEAARRQIGIRHYPVQILGGIALHQGCIAEMQTGEGKTLTATLPLFLNALRGMPVHLATANDYLARRDSDWMRPVYESLGLTVGAITGDMSPAQRGAAYDCDITYGTAREFGFDFLRDRLTLKTSGHSGTKLFSESLGLSTLSVGGALRPGQSSPTRVGTRATVQRSPLHFALIDEADSLLIDEARTPLIISSQSSDARTQEALFRWCASAAERFERSRHIGRDENATKFELTQAGYRLLRALPKPPALNELPVSELIDGVTRAVYVAESLHRDQQYVVRDGAVELVDEYTGRIAEGRKWRNGVHQAVEAREGVAITPQTLHCARITVQELFSLYDRISGMTGTASSAAYEFLTVFNLPVIRVPTRLSPRRVEWSPQVLATSEERFAAVAAEAASMHQSGRPVLIGTRTIQQSEQLSSLLQNAGLPHEVLNALNHESEAEIITDAGAPGRVTVATNMAGRGTDIGLQGNAEQNGGLHVICCEPHSSARIDRQLVGRCARQGDPGSCHQFMSLDDEILRLGYGEEEAARLARRHAAMPSVTVPDFVDAQRIVERQHEQDRRLLVAHTRTRATQLQQLGQDPWLDAI
jgi:preprotein translocase subunit SecA